MKREFILKSDYDRKAFASRLSAIAETKPLRVVESVEDALKAVAL